MQLTLIKKHRKNKNLCRFSYLLAVLLCNFCCNPLLKSNPAKETHSIEDIRSTAKQFLLQHALAGQSNETTDDIENTELQVKIGRIDPRIRLNQCDVPLEAFFPQYAKTSGKVTLGVRCNGSVAWKIFVSATVKHYQQVWVAARNLSKNDLLTKSDVLQKKLVLNDGRRMPLQDLSLIVGTSPKRNMRAGSVIYQDSLCLVCRGNKVSVNAKNSFINISADGVALADAILGESVQIKNSQSKKIFTAIVIGRNQLSVEL